MRPPLKKASTLYVSIMAELGNGAVTWSALYRQVANGIPPAQALRKQEYAVWDQWKKRLRRRGESLDQPFAAVRIGPLEARVETGRKLIFRKKMSDLVRQGTVIVYVDDDGVRQVALPPSE